MLDIPPIDTNEPRGSSTFRRSTDINALSRSTVELRLALSKVVALCMTALEPLSKYGSVWINYPSDHIDNHRISKHLASLQELYNNLTLEKLINVQVFFFSLQVAVYRFLSCSVNNI